MKDSTPKDDFLDELYAQTKNEQPGAKLDEAILAQAKQQVEQPKPSSIFKWQRYASVAAVMVFSFYIILDVNDQRDSAINEPFILDDVQQLTPSKPKSVTEKVAPPLPAPAPRVLSPSAPSPKAQSSKASSPQRIAPPREESFGAKPDIVTSAKKATPVQEELADESAEEMISVDEVIALMRDLIEQDDVGTFQSVYEAFEEQYPGVALPDDIEAYAEKTKPEWHD
jgi:type IV secretory pathway VirB10-like protein